MSKTLSNIEQLIACAHPRTLPRLARLMKFEGSTPIPERITLQASMACKVYELKVLLGDLQAKTEFTDNMSANEIDSLLTNLRTVDREVMAAMSAYRAAIYPGVFSTLVEEKMECHRLLQKNVKDREASRRFCEADAAVNQYLDQTEEEVTEIGEYYADFAPASAD